MEETNRSRNSMKLDIESVRLSDSEAPKETYKPIPEYTKDILGG